MNVTTAVFAENCQPIGLDPTSTTLYFNAFNPSGALDAFASPIDDVASDRSLTSANPLMTLTHRGLSSAVWPWMLLEVAEGTPAMASSAVEVPGKGYNNQIFLMNLQTGKTTELCSGREGTIWASLSSDATRLIWAEMVQTAQQSDDSRDFLLGVWRLHVATIAPTGITNEQVYPTVTGGAKGDGRCFMEPYGQDSVGNWLFASDCWVNATNPWCGHWFASQVWSLPSNLQGTPTRISPAIGGENIYAEFCRELPPAIAAKLGAGRWYVFSSNWSTTPSNGLDLCAIQAGDTTGETLVQLTTYNRQAYAVVGGLMFNPAQPNVIYANVMSDFAGINFRCDTLTFN